MEEILTKLVNGQENKEIVLKEIKTNILVLNQKAKSNATAIKQLEQQFGQMLATLNQRQTDTLV